MTVRKPSKQALAAVFPEQAAELRKALESFQRQEWQHISFDAAAVLEQCNTLLDGHGIEGAAESGNCRRGFSYVNRGDSYDTTIVFVSTGHDTGYFYLGSWADFVERAGSRYQ